jgi:CHASE1-domain containing sensor protein
MTMRLLRPAHGDGQRMAMPAAVFLLGLCLSAFAAWQVQRNIDTQARTDFERNAERVAEEVGRRIRQPVYGLKGAIGLYAASASVNRAALGAYVASRDLPKEFPGVRGFGFVQRVEDADLRAFELAARADGAPGFRVRSMDGGVPDTGHQAHWIIKYMEPAADHAALPGVDVGADSTRREAIERAVATGQPALTAMTALIGRDRPTPGFVWYLPVYRHGAPGSTPAERSAGLVGVLFAPVAMNDALSADFDLAAGVVEVALLDGTGQLALDEPSFGSAAAPAGAADPSRGGGGGGGWGGGWGWWVCLG